MGIFVLFDRNPAPGIAGDGVRVWGLEQGMVSEFWGWSRGWCQDFGGWSRILAGSVTPGGTHDGAASSQRAELHGKGSLGEGEFGELSSSRAGDECEQQGQ